MSGTIPEVKTNITPITPGVSTSEYKTTVRTQTVLSIVTIISAIATPIVGTMPQGSWKYALGTGILAGLSTLAQALVQIGYIKSRTDVKTSPYTGEIVPPVAK